jgi:uncharacterized protein YndB with AHSA1/START domain
MRSATVTTVLDATPRAVFEYLSDIENLPEWANEFAGELRREGDDFKVVTGLGEFDFHHRGRDGHRGHRHVRRPDEGLDGRVPYEVRRAARRPDRVHVHDVPGS